MTAGSVFAVVSAATISEAIHQWAGASDPLLSASDVVLDEPATEVAWVKDGPSLRVTCPVGTSPEAAEALRAELAAGAPMVLRVELRISVTLPCEWCGPDADANDRARRASGECRCGHSPCECER